MPDDAFAHAPDAETLIRHRPYSAAILWLLTLVMGCAGLAILGLPFYMARDVAVDASRGSGQLVITRTYPLLGPRREVLPLAGIRAAGLRSRTTKNGPPVFGVTLLTDAGERDIASEYAGTGRQAQQRALAAFLADPEAAPLHLDYDRGSAWGFLLYLTSLVWLWVLWTIWQEATLRFEWWRRAVVLERRRWPLPPWSRALRLDEVAGVRVDERGGAARRQHGYRVVLSLAGGEDLPVLRSWSSDGPRARATAARISEALARR